MRTTTDTASNANPRNIFIKKIPPTKILCQRTKHTFIFLPTHEANPKKNERVFSPTLFSPTLQYVTLNRNCNFVVK